MTFISDINEWAERCMNDAQWTADCMARIYRFGGQHPTATVLNHSLEVAWMCRHMTPDAQLWALHHDAHEIISGEVTRPFKSLELQVRQTEADKVLLANLRLKIGRQEWCEIQKMDALCGDCEHAKWDKYCWQFMENWDHGSIAGIFVREVARLSNDIGKHGREY